MSLLEIENLRIELPGAPPVALVDGVSLEVGEGTVVGVAGESGSGKTLTGLAALGFVPDRAVATGSVRFDGHDVLTMDRRRLQRLRGNDVAMVFQDPMTSMHPMLSIGRQLTEHVRVHLGMSRKAARARAVELLDRVRIPDPDQALELFPHHFSGGMRQRIAIASALACEPRLLVADEPTTALDVTVQAGILRLLDQLRRETGMAVLLISHDLGVMSALAGELLVFYSGSVVERGTTRELLQTPRHPYTRSLLDCLPDPASAGRPLAVITGEPPSPDARPDGCAFAPRCGFVVDSCRVGRPPLVTIGDGDRRSACPVDPLPVTVAGAHG